jgi:hypothetical protein
MLISKSDLGRRTKLGFTWWRMVTWLLLLAAAYSSAQYLHLARQVWDVLQTVPVGDDADATPLHGILAWYVGSLVACFLVIVACAGCILRQGWARPVLRAIALVLCLWGIYRGVLSWQQWHALREAGPALLANLQLAELSRISLIMLVLSSLAVPILLWLAWQLGQPAVRLQFRSRRG